MSKTYSKCSDCGRMDYIGGGTVCIACEREKTQRAIRDAICPTYAVCEKCCRRFACGNVPTTVCDTCDAASRAEDFAKSLLRKADAEITRLSSEATALRAMNERWVKAATKNYPINWAMDPGNPELTIANVVEGAQANALAARDAALAEVERVKELEAVCESVAEALANIADGISAPITDSQHTTKEAAATFITHWANRLRAALTPPAQQQIETHKPLNLPADRSVMIQKAIDADEYWCDQCPHAKHLHNPDGSCPCGVNCATRRRRNEQEPTP